MILILSPLLVLVIALASLHFRGNPVYVQKRVGWKGKTFRLLKFRSLKMEDRFETVTWFGRLIRATSIDELPQIFNILKGEMSFVGPRPLLPEYLKYYNEAEKRRHEVKPGITGLSQIRIGNSSEWDQRMELDIVYVSRQSFLFDLRILIETIGVFLNFRKRDDQDVEIEKFSDFASRR